ncbi:02ca43f0-d2fe-431c-a3f9-caf27f8ed92e [Sclerotinia trifoliorum]|uniref:02ca43f0-d2fe-431c-a3f9-caf27f8ed92e n=1 Tax=Sclerotinia trifoliorum TaxID=28548 RepID=A0A8H2VU79_9HELO|nr:02ca43f0-d2fe-431c-a3f9-caf27f8ed92e [Sclerotinia trifoliorum]
MAHSAPPNISLPSRDQFDTHDEGHSSASDSEYQHALEVVFDAQNAHRRKSSLVTADTPLATFQRRKNTECYVHALLESQRKAGRASSSGLEGIAETLAPRRIASDSDGVREGEDKSPDPKIHNHVTEEEDCGQVDETSWRDTIKAKDAAQAVEDDASGKVEFQADGIDAGATHSRLLTKKQLSDMAWGVRELSKRLGSIRLKLKVRTVFILTKAHDESLIANTREVTRWLLSPERQVRYTVYVEENLRDSKKFDAKGLLDELEKAEEGQVNGDKHKRLRYWSSNMCRTRPHTFDFIVTLGGDGTVLYASWLFQRIVPPVLSFALGSLGFLTKFDFGDFEKQLTTAFRDGVTISLRLRFEGTVMRSQSRRTKAVENGENGDENSAPRRDLVEELVGEEMGEERTHRPDGTYEILNDIVVDRGPNPTMSSIEIFGDDEHFTSVQADGVCVATPTGSTAYNLAAGGSLCHPENPVILVSAICAHTLSFRPIILPDTIVLRLGVPYDARTSSWASFDGRERVELAPGDYVTISASRYPFANVMPQGRRSEDWVNSISGKLGWNTRQRQKGYKEWSS